MVISPSSLLLIIEVNHNFYKVTDQNKTAIAIGNNKPACILTKFREDDFRFP